MDQRTRNPFDLHRENGRLRFISLIDGLTVECDAHCRMEVKAAELLMAQHNEHLAGLQDVCGLPHRATLQQRQAMYAQWNHKAPNLGTGAFSSVPRLHDSERYQA